MIEHGDLGIEEFAEGREGKVGLKSLVYGKIIYFMLV
jgi:hypothetical protein